jgi:hypothetical protein
MNIVSLGSSRGTVDQMSDLAKGNIKQLLERLSSLLLEFSTVPFPMQKSLFYCPRVIMFRDGLAQPQAQQSTPEERDVLSEKIDSTNGQDEDSCEGQMSSC